MLSNWTLDGPRSFFICSNYVLTPMSSVSLVENTTIQSSNSVLPQVNSSIFLLLIFTSLTPTSHQTIGLSLAIILSYFFMPAPCQILSLNLFVYVVVQNPYGWSFDSQRTVSPCSSNCISGAWPYDHSRLYNEDESLITVRDWVTLNWPS